MLVEDLGTIAQYQTLPDSGYVTLSINGAVRVDTVAAVQLVPIIKIDGGSSTAVGSVTKACANIDCKVIAYAIVNASTPGAPTSERRLSGACIRLVLSHFRVLLRRAKLSN